jgi:quercetin dioxygenase-like cupin family protein
MNDMKIVDVSQETISEYATPRRCPQGLRHRARAAVVITLAPGEFAQKAHNPGGRLLHVLEGTGIVEYRR